MTTTRSILLFFLHGFLLFITTFVVTSLHDFSSFPYLEIVYVV